MSDLTFPKNESTDVEHVVLSNDDLLKLYNVTDNEPQHEITSEVRVWAMSQAVNNFFTGVIFEQDQVVLVTGHKSTKSTKPPRFPSAQGGRTPGKILVNLNQ